jgi:hypothetical protein
MLGVVGRNEFFTCIAVGDWISRTYNRLSIWSKHGQDGFRVARPRSVDQGRDGVVRTAKLFLR